MDATWMRMLLVRAAHAHRRMCACAKVTELLEAHAPVDS